MNRLEDQKIMFWFFNFTTMESAVIDANSSLLKVTFAFPDQTPTMVITSFDSDFSFYQNNNVSFLVMVVYNVCDCFGLDYP